MAKRILQKKVAHVPGNRGSRVVGSSEVSSVHLIQSADFGSYLAVYIKILALCKCRLIGKSQAAWFVQVEGAKTSAPPTEEGMTRGFDDGVGVSPPSPPPGWEKHDAIHAETGEPVPYYYQPASGATLYP